MQLFKELQRRNVFRVAIGYVVSCWLLAQVADMVLGNIGAPGWVMQTILLVLVLGFPVVVFFSWAYEVTPDGIKRESEVDRSQSITHMTGRKLDRAIIAVLVIALGYLVWQDRFAPETPPGGTESARPGQAADAGQVDSDAGTMAGTHSGPEVEDNSIAVLPFVNMSSDPEQEYFSDGLSEELLNVLAQNPKLRVAARTSSFSFKNQHLEISEIAERLKVSHVVEGSVRKSGNRVRITAQLIQAKDGYHLWSETYDRTLDNVFNLQEEIAGRISAALLPQVIKSGAAVAGASGGSINRYTPPTDVFQTYLQARNQFNQRTSSSREKALELMTPLVRDNPDYADAQAFYALLTFESSNRTGGDIPWITAEARSRKALERALSLNPELAEAYLVKGHLAERSHDIDVAISMYERAIEINPSYSDAYVSLAEASMAAQRPDRAWEALNLSRTLDPVSPYVLETVARIATLYDRPEMAEEAMDVLWRVAPETASLLQSTLYLDRGDAARALIQLEHHLAQFPDADHMDVRLAYAYARLGMREKAAELSPRVKMIIAANDGDKDLALRLADKLAAGMSDPHDRADEYWMPYYSLGMYDDALTVLSDLWYGYAEEQMGPRMDSLDCYVLAALLLREGRHEEAAPLIELLQKEAPIGLDRWANQIANASLKLLNGDLDSAMRILQDLADEKHFSQFFGTPYWQFLGLRDHPDYPALVAKFVAWQQEQYEIYRKLKAAEKP